MLRSIAYRSVAIHALVFVVVNALLVFAWSQLAEDGATFWPAWSLVGWGALLVLHAGVTVTVLKRRRERGDRGDAEAHSPEGTPWVAVMFVDLVGSTRLSTTLGDEAWSDMIATFRDIVREGLGRHGGREVGTQGDGVLLCFDDPADAVGCARDLAGRLRSAHRDGELETEARIGIHAGRVVERDDDVLGTVVNIASRVADAAGPGEVLVTEPVVDHAGGAVAAEDRGLVPLKGLEAPRHLLSLQLG